MYLVVSSLPAMAYPLRPGLSVIVQALGKQVQELENWEMDFMTRNKPSNTYVWEPVPHIMQEGTAEQTLGGDIHAHLPRHCTAECCIYQGAISKKKKAKKKKALPLPARAVLLILASEKCRMPGSIQSASNAPHRRPRSAAATAAAACGEPIRTCETITDLEAHTAFPCI